MTRNEWIGVLGQRVLFGFLLLLSGMAGLALYRADAARRAPDIGRYAWAVHTHVLLLAYKKDCGCGPSPEQWVEAGLQKRLDVLLVSSQPQKDWSGLRTRCPVPHLQTRDDVPLSTISRLTPTGNLMACLVENGKIGRRGSARDIDNLLAP